MTPCVTDQGIILAAGLGTRLAWLTRQQPKALMPIAGIPAIVRVIQRMVHAGIRHIAINIHHHAEQIRRALGNGDRFGVQLYYSYESTLLDSGGGVRQAILHLPSPDHVIVHNADICTDMNLSRLQQQETTLVMVPNPGHHPAGDFSVDRGSVVPGNADSYTFSGISCWPAALLLAQPAATPFSLVELIRQQITARQCHAIIHRGLWLDVGRPHDLFRASRIMASATHGL